LVQGGGTAGLVTELVRPRSARRWPCAQHDPRGLLGEDCLNVGGLGVRLSCGRRERFADVRDAGPVGAEVLAGVRVDFAAFMERMRRLCA